MAKQKLKEQKPAKGSWLVEMTCKVTRVVTCENCTEDEARNDPFSHAIDEQDTGMIDWKVDGVEAND